METWDAITSRRNVREFADRPIGDEDLDRILEAGRRAPSSRNWQPWDFVVVTDRAQLSSWRRCGAAAGTSRTPRRRSSWSCPMTTTPTGAQRAAYDVGQATVQMMVAAADLGIGSGHSAVGDQARAREILGFPDDRYAYIMIDFGYPAEPTAGADPQAGPAAV